MDMMMEKTTAPKFFTVSENAKKMVVLLCF